MSISVKRNILHAGGNHEKKTVMPDSVFYHQRLFFQHLCICRQGYERPVLDIQFGGNWLLNTYAVNVYLDDEKVDTIPHGKDYAQLIEGVGNGTHSISFRSYDDASIQGEAEFEMKGDTTFQCSLYANKDEITVSHIKVIDNVDLSAISVPDLTGVILSDAQKDLEKAGFVNVKAESAKESVWNEDNWIVTDQNLKPGTTAQKNEEFTLTCTKTASYLEERLNDLTITEAQKKAMSDQEKEEWVVKEIDPNSHGKRKADAVIVCTGNREVPEVVDLALDEALKLLEQADFSDVVYESVSGKGVWNDSNWKVMSQSVEPGETIAADSKIQLTVKSYKELTEEGEVTGEEDRIADQSLSTADEEKTDVGTDDETDDEADVEEVFVYEHDPRESPEAMMDIIENPDAVYGFSPDPESERLGSYAQYDWTDPELVEKAQEERIEYHESMDSMTDILYEMREDGASMEEMARAVSEERNRLRIESYEDDPEALAALKESNLKAYGHEEGPTPEELYEKYGSWTTVLQKAFSPNLGMDACCGLYDEYYWLYIELGYVEE